MFRQCTNLKITVIYCFIDSYITGFLPIIRISQQPDPASTEGVTSHESTLTSISTVLTRWHTLWIGLQKEVQREEWEAMGFYKNGYNFWLLTQLLVRKSESTNLLLTEGQCDDKLEKLNALVKEESEW